MTPEEDRRVNYEFRKLHRQISTLKKKAGVAHDMVVAAEARSHDCKLRAKAAEGSLSKLEPHAHRYLWLKRQGAEVALALLGKWETEMWDELIDKQRRVPADKSNGSSTRSQK